MKPLINSVRELIRSEGGPTAVEYAVMLALIVALCLPTIVLLGGRVNATFWTLYLQLRNAGS